MRDVLSGRCLALLEDAQPQEVEARSAVHLAFDELEPMDLTFDVALAPRQSERLAHSVEVSFKPSSEVRKAGPSCGFQPC